MSETDILVQISHQLGELNSSVRTLQATMVDQSTRLAKLESSRFQLKGGLALVALVGGSVTFLLSTTLTVLTIIRTLL